MADSNSQVVDALLTLGRDKAYAEIGQLLSGLDEGVLYSLVEEDLGALSGDVSARPGTFRLTTLAFKGGCALIEKGATLAGETILGTAASACVSQICEDDPKDDSGKRWSVICDRLLEVLPQLGSRSVIDVSFRILAELKACGSTPSSLQSLLPMLLDTLGTIGPVEIATDGVGASAVPESGGGSTITRTGLALKSYWVGSACSYRWDPKASVAVCALLREIALSERQVELVANRMLRQLRLAELNELPAMVYQLLLFARNGFKRQIIGGVLEFFDSLEDECSATASGDAAERQKRWCELGDIEGTVMLHINYSIKQDFELGDALIAHAKERGDLALAAASSPSTFSFACLLALARIHRFEDAVMGLLRTSIVKSIHDAMALASTAWARPYLAPIQLSAQQQLLAAVVARSSYGWDQVTQSLVQLCLGVMDYAGSAATIRRGIYSAQACASARAVSAQALRAAFGVHEFVRAEVVEQILSRVVFRADSHRHFLALLGELVADDSDVVRVFIPKFVDVLDSISAIPPAGLERLLEAISPIILDDAQFRSSLVLVLRKILFAHSLDDRRTALGGLFVLAASFAGALEECSDRLGSAALAAAPGETRHLQRRVDELASALLEVLGLLRRCLTQQPEVRAASYERLGSLLDMACVRRNSLLLGALHDIFRVEFAKYYRPPAQSRGCSPIDMQLCLHPVTSKVIMPVASFLHCYAKLVVASCAPAQSSSSSSSSSSSPSLGTLAARAWRDLCLRFSQAQIEDFELDPTGDYSLDSQFGQRNFSTAHLVIGCLDACLGYALAHIIHVAPATAIVDIDVDVDNEADDVAAVPPGNLADPVIVVELFSKFSRFGDILSSRCIDERRKKVIPLVSDLSLLSLDSVVAVLRLVLPDRQRADNASHPLNRDQVADHDWFVSRLAKAELWSANPALVKHLLEVALARVQRRPVAGNFIGSSNSFSSSPVVQQQPEPASRALLEIAYIVYSGVLVHFTNGSGQAADDSASSNQRSLPVYLRSRAARGRGVVLISAEILVACMSQFTGAALDRLAAAVMRPTIEMFTDGALVISPDAAAECSSGLLTGLRCAATALLRQKPMAVKDATTVLSAVQVLAVRLSELTFNHNSSLAYKCLHQTAEWTAEMVRSEMPSDLGLMKSLVGLLTSSQVFLQPLAAVTGGSGVTSPVGNHRLDRVELRPVEELTARMCAASRVHIKDADSFDNEDDQVDDQDLERFTVRSIPALATLLMAWLKSELHRLDWATGQMQRCVHMELDSSSQEELHQSIRAERRICQRFCAVSQVLQQFLGNESLPKAMYDLVLRAFQDVHRTLSLLTRAKMGVVQLPITESYIDVLSLVCLDLNTHAYAILTDKYNTMVGSNADDDMISSGPLKKACGEKGKVAKVQRLKSRVMRDSSLVSSLVYQMELSEKYVMQLSNKFKTPLAHYLKLSTARDFRINISRISDAATSMAVGSDSEDAGGMQHQSPVPSHDEEEDVAVSDNPDQDELPLGYSSSEDTSIGNNSKRARLN
ncbi:hypothetical protein GGI20_003250 [Coemansia sp. BCRC 34301]|nr:hypothetical protein GGI20_003250 [Coemansia sp. BCRC 34301]